ncbi:MAG: hypothetical protein QW400_04530 [Candidatus Diapherotrites archaeon]
MLFVLVVFSLILFWPKAFSYSECGNCEMLGLKQNIDRIVSMRKSFFGYEIEVVANTCCETAPSPKTALEGGVLKLNVSAFENKCASGCICDKKITFNIPSSQGLEIVELYIDGTLVDKRSVVDDKITDGEEFCEQIPSYKARCYRRLAFLRSDPDVCKFSGDEKCAAELQEYMLLKCLSKKKSDCIALFSENSKQETI